MHPIRHHYVACTVRRLIGFPVERGILVRLADGTEYDAIVPIDRLLTAGRAVPLPDWAAGAGPADGVPGFARVDLTRDMGATVFVRLSMGCYVRVDRGSVYAVEYRPEWVGTLEEREG